MSPKNWQAPNSDISKDWYIQYRFYTPEIPAGKFIIVKSGINSFKTRKERKAVGTRLLNELNEALLNGYNPVLGNYVESVETEHEISPETHVCKAFNKALDRLKIEKSTRTDITNILVYIEKAARLLSYDRVKILDIRKKHVKIILEKVGELSKPTSCPMFLIREKRIKGYPELFS